MRSYRVILAVALAAAAFRGRAAPAPDAEPAAPEQPERQTAPVVIDGRPLFGVVGVPVLPAAERAGLVSGRIAALAADRTFDPAKLELAEVELGTSIRARGKNVVTVTEQDAAAQGLPRGVLAAAFTKRIEEAIAAHRDERTPRRLARAAAWAAAWTAGLVLLSLLVLRLARRLERAAERWFEARARFLRDRGLPLVTSEQVHGTVVGLVHGGKIVALLAAGTAYLLIVLDLFPWTRPAAKAVLPVLLRPLASLGGGLVAQLPNLVFLAVLWLLTRFVLRLVRAFFRAVESGTIRLSSFEQEWAAPTFRIVRLVLVAFAIVVAYPHIPGSESSVFKGISLFAGLLFSLGSSSIVANVIAGYTMTYRRAFRLGDRVQIGDVVGNVEEVKVLVTRVRTPKNEEVVIPNSTILSGNVVNYSALARKEGLIVHTTVGIGYETPWRQVEAMLLEAAARTSKLERTPPPFVLFRELGDFCVLYEINGYTRDAGAMVATRTALQRNILDVFNEYGVQIMTPAYEGDPPQPKVVPREQWYAAPARPPEQGEAHPADAMPAPVPEQGEAPPPAATPPARAAS
jgi:small-conductance mechanosensitive channel